MAWTFQLHLGRVKAVKGPDVSCQILSIYIIYIYVSVFFSLPSIPRLGRRPSYVSWCILESQLLGWGARPPRPPRQPRYGERTQGPKVLTSHNDFRGLEIHGLGWRFSQVLNGPEWVGNVAGLGTPTVDIIQCGCCPARLARLIESPLWHGERRSPATGKIQMRK